MKPYLSVIIPSYNEIKNLNRNVLDEVYEYLKNRDYTWELLLSDDGSTDGTLAELHNFAKKHPGTKVLDNPHAGKGPTVQSGILATQGEWRLFTDFDQSTPISEIEKLLPYSKSHDIIIGSRELKGAQRDKEPWYRHLMGRGFNFLVQMLAIPGIFDTRCGFKLLKGSVATELFTHLVVYGRQQARQDAFTGAFDVEILYLARKQGYSIKEIPILWRHHETDRVSPVKDSLRMLRDIFRVRLTDMQGKYRL